MGRTSIYMVIGFCAIMLITGKNMSDVGVQALDNSLSYYENTQRYTLAVAAANLVCSKVWETPSWTTGYSNINYNGGTFSATVTDLGGGKKEIAATATYGNSSQTVTIVMKPSNFSKFAYYGGTSASAAAWETGDTVGGPSHTQGKLKTFGSPVFMGKATSLSGITKSGSPATPQFQGGFESGVSITMPNNTSYTNILTAATSGGYGQTGGTLYLKFNADGTISWKTSAAASYSTQSLSSFSPNGVIAIDKGTLYVEGTLDGRVTLASLRTSGSSGGTTVITNNLVMKDDPRSNPTSNDVLGIVSYGDVTIADNSATQFNVQATMYSYTGGLAVQNGTSRPAGTLSIYGGMIVERLYATSNGAAGSARRGYNLSLRFDSRFSNDSPDYFPATGKYEILSWFE
ncbi:MAG: hypothetical protein HYV29_10200 [Ignavibacteriales bacterium]|nr:hypothetical protein [Ignavibacteriales bacterium]